MWHLVMWQALTASLAPRNNWGTLQYKRSQNSASTDCCLSLSLRRCTGPGSKLENSGCPDHTLYRYTGKLSLLANVNTQRGSLKQKSKNTVASSFLKFRQKLNLHMKTQCSRDGDSCLWSQHWDRQTDTETKLPGVQGLQPTASARPAKAAQQKPCQKRKLKMHLKWTKEIITMY